MRVIFVFVLIVLLCAGICHVTFCSFDAAAVMQAGNVFTNPEQIMSIPFWWVSWTHSAESLVIGLLVFLLMYYRMMHDEKLFSHEKLGLVLGIVRKTQTPLILIQNLLQDITISELPEPALEKIKRVLRHVDHLADCYNFINDFERVEKKMKVELHSVEWELYSYVTSIVNQCRPYAELRKINLNITKHFESASCQIDDTMMSAALQYLLWKIIDITPCQNDVYIDIMYSDRYWSLQIINYQENEKDNKKMMLSISALLFVSFGRSVRIIRKIVRQQGGKVTLRSWGKKVELEIVTPLNDKCVSTTITTKSELAENTKVGVNRSPSTCEEEGYVKPDLFVETAKEHCILLVMSDKKLSDYLNDALSTHFYVTVLEQPEDVFRLIHQKRPDAIIIDENINGIHGKELCSKIKSVTGITNIPVLLLIDSHDSYLIHFRCGADRLDFRRVNVCRLKVDIQALIDIYTNQRRLIDNLLANQFLANQPEILDRSGDDALFMEEVQRHLEENLTKEGYTIDMLSADMAMSRTRFYTKIREITGKSPAECINSFKMYRAKILLITEQYSITEIANLLGYCDAKYFGKVFKKYYHVSPSEYTKSVMKR